MTPDKTQQPPQPVRTPAQPTSTTQPTQQTFQNGYYATQGQNGSGAGSTTLSPPSSAPSTPAQTTNTPQVQTFSNGAYANWGQPQASQPLPSSTPAQTTNTPTAPATQPAPQTAPATGTNPVSQIPGLQTFIDSLQANKVPGGVQTNVDTSNVPPLVGGDALQQQTQQAQQAAYKQATAYLDPQWANAENSLRNSLVNQGIPQNSEAWNKAMDDFQRQKAFAYQQAETGAVQQGLQAQNQLFGQGLAANQNQFGQNLSGGRFTNAAQAQVAQQILQQLGYGTQLGIAGMGAQTAANQLAEQFAQNNFNNSMTMRNQDINELLLQQQNPLQMFQALTQGNGITPPNFTSTPGANIGGTDIASIIAQAMGQGNNVYNAQVGAQNSNTAAAASIIAALLSDRKLKTNVRKIGMHEIGIPLYSFDYVWGEPGIGVMADEVEKVMPQAVFEVGPYKAVNYAEFSKVA